MDFLDSFIEDMRAHGNGPAHLHEIIADDKIHRYQLEDERGTKKSGVYQLKAEGDYAVGWHRSHREGVTHKWSSKARRDYTPEEKAAWREKIKAERKLQAEKIKNDQKAAAEKAKAIWAQASRKGESEYLLKKNVKPHGVRFHKNMVCVPIYIKDEITSLQFISASSEKRFIKGSELVGGYFPIAKKDDDLSTIVICEGFATGGSIREATGLPVVVAFNAGNLEPVADIIRTKYPNALICIAADNDQFTKNPKGEPWNPGIEKAQNAAAKIGGAIITYPAFDEKDLAGKPTDFNDAVKIYGLPHIQAIIDAALAHGRESSSFYAGQAEYSSGSRESADDVQPSDLSGTTGHMPPDVPFEAYEQEMKSVKTLANEDDWRSLLLTNEEGKLKASSLRNMITIMSYHSDFRGIFAYNEFHHNIMIVRCPPWESFETFSPKRLDDVTITHCAAEFEKFGLAASTDKAFKAIQAVAYKQSFHPARDYFNSIVWDGKRRLDTWLTYYLGCEQDAPEYLEFVGTKWVVAAVKRVFEPGCKFDQVLVIEGAQGIGKSTALKELATFGKDKPVPYFTDAVTLSDIHNKDTIMKLQGSMIIELSELSGFSKKEDEEIKKWIGVTFDDARLPYAREVSRFERQFVLAATTNQTSYLRDPSGNRRFWPVHAARVDLSALIEDREQLWAEAVRYYRDGMRIVPTWEEEKLAVIEHRKRMSYDSWQDDVNRAADEVFMELPFSGPRGFKIAAIMVKMQIPLRDRDSRSERRIAGILQSSGYESRPVWTGEKTERLWVKKGD